MNRRKRVAAGLFCFALLTLILYGNVIRFQFVNYDDDVILLKNSVVHNFNVHAMFAKEVAGDYIPLTLLTYAVEDHFFKLDPAIYHFDNLFLHVIDCLLVVYLIFELTSGNIFIAGVTGLLFVVHPLHVQSVAWVTERKDVLCTFFYLLSFIFYLKYAKGIEQKKFFYCLSLTFFVAALLSKAMALTLPFVFLLADFTVLKRSQKILATFLEKIPFLIFTAIDVVIHLMIHDTNTLISAPDFNWAMPLKNGLDSLTFYVTKSLIPVGLTPFYKQGVAVIAWWEYALAALVLVGVLFLVFRKLEGFSKSLVIFAGVFFLISIAPVLQVVPYGNHFIYADHYFYIPGLGLLLIYSIALQSLWNAPTKFKTLGRGTCVSLVAIVTVAFAVLTFNRVQVWRTSETLWKDAIKKSPNNPLAYFNLGGYYTFDSGRPAEALPIYDKELELTPDDPLAHFNRGMALNKLGRPGEAIEEFEKALKLAPGVKQIHFNLAILYDLEHRYDDAVKVLSDYIDEHPTDVLAHTQLGKVYLHAGRMDDAAREYSISDQLKLQNQNLDQ